MFEHIYFLTMLVSWFKSLQISIPFRLLLDNVSKMAELSSQDHVGISFYNTETPYLTIGSVPTTCSLDELITKWEVECNQNFRHIERLISVSMNFRWFECNAYPKHNNFENQPYIFCTSIMYCKLRSHKCLFFTSFIHLFFYIKVQDQEANQGRVLF